MGLDMYLEADLYVGGKFEHNNVKGKCEFTMGQGEHLTKYDIALKELSSITIEVGYWRKANAIHAWFVSHVQNGVDECQRSYVTRDKLEELSKLCTEVLEHPETAPEKLSSQQGFFFGSTDYGNYYLDDLRSTIKIITRALELTDAWDIYYRASW